MSERSSKGVTADLVSAIVSTGCVLRSVPLFFRATPRTPLRVLGIMAFDTLHVLRRSRWLPRKRVEQLAMFVDLEGLANAACDHKVLSEEHYRALRERLERAGAGPDIDSYLSRLQALEHARPPIGGDRHRFEDVCAYREAVARLSIESAAAIALGEATSGRGRDADIETLVRILMQCQIIDDVLDYRVDAAGALPSFVTACTSLPLAMTLTSQAVRDYASPSAGSVLPLRVALRVLTLLARVTVALGRPTLRNARQFAQ